MLEQTHIMGVTLSEDLTFDPHVGYIPKRAVECLVSYKETSRALHHALRNWHT